MSDLPEWVYHAVNGTQRERDLHEALAIAWEALKHSKASDKTPTYDYGQKLRNGAEPGIGKRFLTPKELAAHAMHQIGELGK